MRQDIIKKNQTLSEEHIKLIESLIQKLQFGSITLVVQDGRIVQVEKNEKVRLA